MAHSLYLIVTRLPDACMGLDLAELKALKTFQGHVANMITYSFVTADWRVPGGLVRDLRARA